MEYKFDIVISFAGEDREIAAEINNWLQKMDVSTFYDFDHKDALWGENLSEVLNKVYETDGRYCLMLISENYLKKSWTRHERRSALSRMIDQEEGYVLPYLIGLDKLDVPGIPNDLGFLTSKSVSVYELCNQLVNKLKKNKSTLEARELEESRLDFQELVIFRAAAAYLMEARGCPVFAEPSGDIPIRSVIRNHVHSKVDKSFFNGKVFDHYLERMERYGLVEEVYSDMAGTYYGLTEDGVAFYNEEH